MPEVRSPLESQERAIRISDMIASQTQRAQEAKYRQEEAPVRQAELALRRKKAAVEEAQLEEDTILKNAFRQTMKYNDETGDIDYDQEKASTILPPELLPRYRSEVGAQKAEDRKAAMAEANAWLSSNKIVGDVVENFTTIKEEERPDQWINFRRALVKLDPQAAAALPQKYTPEILPALQGMIQQRDMVRSTAEKLAAAQKAEEEALDLQTKKAAATKAETDLKKATKIDEFTNASGERVLAMQQPDGTVTYEKSSEKVKTISDKQAETELIEEAYGQLRLKGKTRDKMTAAEKVAAKRWDEAASKNADPTKRTDLDKMMELYRSPKPEDRALFNALKGNFDNGPTMSNRISMIGQANTAANQEVSSSQDRKKSAYDRVRGRFLKEYPDFPTFDSRPFVGPMPESGGPTAKAAPEKAAAPPAAPAKPASTTTRMRSPDGEEQDVPPGLVEHYKTLGATIVK